MALQQITASDIAVWDSLQDIADSFEKRGLKPRPNLGEDHELVLQLADDEFVTIVEAGPGESATDFKPQNRTRHTNLVATNDYEGFTFITRVRSWEGQQHGRIKHQKLSFTKEQFESKSGEKNTILKKLNSIEYGSSAAIYDTLYDTQQVVKEFYQQFESLRTDLVQEVSGIPDDRGDAKQRYVRVVLDRMIFLYFIQEKRLLDRNPDYLHEQPAEVVDEGDDRYEKFYAPLFFDYLAEDKQNPDFGKLPYLNGGLFAKNPVEEEFEDAKLGDSAEETNKLFDEILDFLSDWNWNVDERLDIVDPKNLSPAVLGHIFEQTVNQKEMGAYYTPEEITGFMARRTVHPYLLDKLNEAVGATYDELDDVFGFVDGETGENSAVVADGGTVTQQAPTENINVDHIEVLYHDILKEARILDPAVGSGAFLLAVQEVLLDIYMQCTDFFKHLEEKGRGWELESRTRDELERIDSGSGNSSLYAKRTIILNNLYGVDIDEGAVEICKLRLWLSMVADIEDEPGEVEPLPNIDFNIRQGNTLIGFVNGLEAALDSVQDTTTVQATIGSFGKNSVKRAIEEIHQAIENHKQATSSEEATKWRHEAEERIEKYREVLNEKTATEFRDAVDEDVSLETVKTYEPFHWVIEFPTVFRDGGFDVAIGNPPWDKVKAERTDFFPRYDEVFRARSDDGKDEIQSSLLDDPDIQKEWDEYQEEISLEADYYKESPTYQLQSSVVDGRTLSGDQEKSTIFLERLFSLIHKDGYVSQLFPGILFSGGSNKSLRMNLLNENHIQHIVGFENKGIFDNIDRRKKFAIVTFKPSGSTDAIPGIFMQQDVDILRNIESYLTDIPTKVIDEFDPEAKLYPFIQSKTHLDVIEKLLKNPQLRERPNDTWYAEPYAELHRSSDRDRFINSEEDGDYPVYSGSTIYQFEYDNNPIEFWSVEESKSEEKSAKYRVKEKNLRKLKRKIYNSFDGTGSQKGFVNDLLEERRGKELSEEDVLLDCTEYRIVYRNATSPTNERTLLCAIIPKGVVCHNALRTIRPYEIKPTEDNLKQTPLHGAYERIFSDEELLVAVGLLNSIPVDYLMRSKVEENINIFHFEGTQVPRLTEGDDWFDFIWQRAAKLNCYGDEFLELREKLDVEPATNQSERRELQAEIDAAAFHAYGLNKEEVEFVLGDFHTVNDPRLMNGEYLEMVSEKFQSIMPE